MTNTWKGPSGASSMTVVQEKVNKGRNRGQIPSVYNNKLHSNGGQKELINTETSSFCLFV